MRIPSLRSWLVPLQCMIALAGFASLTLAPPANGAMLVVSLIGQDASTIASWATAGQTQLLGAGPIPASLRISGSRSDLVPIALRHGSVLIRGDEAICGQAVTA